MPHEIFISYSSKHRDLTQQLAAVIEGQYGLGSVWWDHALESRASYAQQIKAALEKARVIVVVWTAGAMISDYVYAEAVRAKDASKLVNVRPADMAFRDIPEPFNIYHIDEAEDHARILTTIANVMGGVPMITRVPLHELYYRQHGHRLIDPKHRPVSRDARDLRPTELLQARYEVVPFFEATGAKQAVLDWCLSARPTAGRLVHGPGGLGKTRLMIDVASALRARGWTAGFFDRPHEQVEATIKQRSQAIEQLIDHGEDRGLLIIMDYAEGRQGEIKVLAQRLTNRSNDGTRPIRLMLLTRSAGDWWTTLIDETPEIERLFLQDGARGADVMALEAITSGEQRLALFAKSVEALAPLMQTQGFTLPKGQPDPARLHRIETGDANTRPLAIQMEALLYLASAAPDSEARGVDELLRKVLGVERDHWRKIIGPLDDDRMRDLSRGVAQVTAVQGVNGSASAERLLAADDFYKGQRTARVAIEPVLRGLTRVYGRSDGGLSHLEPDLIGEHHVATLADVELIEGCVRWIEGEHWAARPKHRRDLLTVIQRATQPEHGEKATQRAANLLDHLIHCHGAAWADDIVAVAIDTPGMLAERLEMLVPQLDAGSIEALHSSMPNRSLKLDGAALALALHLARQSGSDRNSPERAERLGNLGVRYANVGRRAEALAATQEAVEILRELAKEQPAAFLPHLATVLNNFGSDLADLHRQEQALAATRDAVEIRRTLAQDRPDMFLPDLASSLSNFGSRLSELKRWEEALAATQEALAIDRQLAQDRPDAFIPGLAISLYGISRRYSNLGRQEEALAAAQEAVEIFRELAKSQPDAFLPDLAMGLNGMAYRLSALQRGDEAIAASREATDIRRTLARQRPRHFLPLVANSLDTTADMLVALGRIQEADATAREALAILEPFLERDADARDTAEELRKKLL